MLNRDAVCYLKKLRVRRYPLPLAGCSLTTLVISWYAEVGLIKTAALDLNCYQSWILVIHPSQQHYQLLLLGVLNILTLTRSAHCLYAMTATQSLITSKCLQHHLAEPTSHHHLLLVWCSNYMICSLVYTCMLYCQFELMVNGLAYPLDWDCPRSLGSTTPAFVSFVQS